jgi:prepilin-type N-terminal cleavage/methylation domain-containing protein
MNTDQKGFTLIELIIIVLIVAIIAVLAIPNLIAARRAANEASAIASLRTIHVSNAAYQSTAGLGKFAPDLATLHSHGLIDSVLANATSSATPKSGYFFRYVGPPPGADPSVFDITASPSTPPGSALSTGSRYFFVSETGVIYGGFSAPTIDAATRVITGAPINN